jgi:hypothetical protein
MLQILKFRVPVFPSFGFSFLILILITGFLFGLPNGINIDFLRDCWSFAKPILVIYLGVLLGSKVKFSSINKIFRIIIIAGIVSALYHFLEIALVPGFQSLPLQSIREYTRRASLIEVLSAGILLRDLARNKGRLFGRKRGIFLLAILFFSISLFVSRTMFLCLFIYVGYLFDYFKFTLKAFLILIVVGIGIFYLFTLPTQSDQTSFGRLVNKLQKSPGELFFSEENLNSKADINVDWRGYEALMAYTQTIKKGPRAIFFGNGFGSLVDLKITMKLGDEYFRFVPKLHNGYAQLFFKTGLLSIIFFISFSIFLYVRVKKVRFLDNKFLELKKIILASIICIILTTSTIAGIYNDITLDSILLISSFSYIFIKRYSTSILLRVNAEADNDEEQDNQN